MWQLINKTPYSAERCFARDRAGAEWWVVVVKGTFEIGPSGTLSLSDSPAKVCMAPEFYGEPGKSSLMYESDLEMGKQTTDILLHAQAHAPRGKPVEQLDVGMRVGGVSKLLRVFGNRVWSRRIGLSLGSPQPFTQLPITYENAFGGVDRNVEPKENTWERRNPVGVGFAVDSQHLVGQRAPNIEGPRSLITSWKDRPPPAGFGPIARDWSPRVEMAGTYDQKWEQERQPLPPADFDDRFRQCAPLDQQAPEWLRGGEPVVLLNLSQQGELRFTLPRIWLAFSTYLGREIVEHRSRLHTVILEPDALRVIMVWGTSIRCHNKEHKLEKTVIREKKYV